MNSLSYWEEHKRRFKVLTDKIIEEKFVGNTKWVFSKLKRVTKYDTFEKRDGSIVSKALDD